MTEQQQEPDDGLAPPVETEADREFALQLAKAKGYAGSVPLVGPMAAELLAHALQAPLKKRHEAWCIKVTDVLRELQSQGRVNPEELWENEKFIDAFLEVSIGALRTSDARKLEALRNIVMQAAVSSNLDSAVLSIVVRIASQCTGVHFEILEKLKAKLGFLDGTVVQLAEYGDDNRTVIVCKDLERLELIELEPGGRGYMKSRSFVTTFLSYIAEVELES